MLTPSIILIHIGSDFFEYINQCISQLYRFNSCDIYLVLPKEHIPLVENKKVKTIPIESVEKSQEHIDFLNNNKLDATFRNGFWKSATERFFYIRDVMDQFGLKNVFHFENDVLVYCNLENILQTCIECKIEMAAPFDNNKRCIPSFVYFEKVDVIIRLNKFMLKYSNTNDMELIAKYQIETNAVKNFPVVPSTYKWNFCTKITNRRLNKFSENFDKFNALFDAAAFGQYLGGTDSRNPGAKAIGFINESALYNASHFEFEWKLDAEGRKIPIASYRGEKIKINNLHIHSKDLAPFM